MAGAVAGSVAILFERGKGGRRTVIAQQLFVRCVVYLDFCIGNGKRVLTLVV